MSPDDPLSRTLQSWRVTPKIDPQFRASVWQRIEAVRRADGESWGAYLRHHLGAWAAVLVVALGASGWIGVNAAERSNEMRRAHLVAAYVETIDARAHIRP
jgi:hypothetical protein